MPEDSTGHVHEQKEEEQAQDEEGPAAVAGMGAREADLLGVGERKGGREGGREGVRLLNK